MAVDKIESPYFVVIDTNEYTGSFEREMTAFCTGMTGECGKGARQAAEYREEETIDFDGWIGQEADDRGCYRPCSIYDHGNGNGYQSVVIFFDEDPTREQMEVIARRARLFPQESGWTKVQILRVGVYENKVIRKTKLVKLY
jgi:hypothetical protein